MWGGDMKRMTTIKHGLQCGFFPVKPKLSTLYLRRRFYATDHGDTVYNGRTVREILKEKGIEYKGEPYVKGTLPVIWTTLPELGKKQMAVGGPFDDDIPHTEYAFFRALGYLEMTEYAIEHFGADSDDALTFKGNALDAIEAGMKFEHGPKAPLIKLQELVDEGKLASEIRAIFKLGDDKSMDEQNDLFKENKILSLKH